MYITTDLKEALIITLIIVFWICVGLIINDIRFKIKHKKKGRK